MVSHEFSGVDNAVPMERYQDIRGVKTAAFSSDGGLLATLGDESGFNQIWLQDLASGARSRLTDFPEPVGALSFSPVGRDLIATTDCGGDERHRLWFIGGAGQKPELLTPDSRFIHVWGCWAPQGDRIAYSSNARDPFHMDIHVMDLATREVRTVYEGKGHREPMAFVDQGRKLIMREWRAQTDQEIFLVEIETGKVVPLLDRVGRATYLAARPCRDGSGFFLITDYGREFQAVSKYDFASRSIEWLFEPEGCDVQAMALTKDQTRIACTVNREGWSEIVLKDLASGETRTLSDLPPGQAGSPAFSPGARELIVPIEGAATPPALWQHDLDQNISAPFWTAPVGMDIGHFGNPELAQVESFDGRQIPVFVYRPNAGAVGAKRVLIIVHGGPESQWTPIFRPDIQWMLDNNITVIAPNVRGSLGYGRTYQHLDDVSLRMDAVADLRAVRLWTGALPGVDSNRIGVYGRSYGGFMTLSALTQYPELWRLGISFFPPANLETFLETTGPWRQYLRASEFGDPVRDAELLRAVSPMHAIDRIAAPLFLAHGMDDARVPPGESEMVYAALRGRGREVKYVRIPHEGHGFSRIENKHTVFGAMAAFIDRHL